MHDLANMVGWGRRALAILSAAVVALVGVKLVAGDSLWAPPFTWLLWGLGFAGLISVLLMLMAVIVGTPGCELAVWREIAGRQPSQPDDKPMFCLAGLHAIEPGSAAGPGTPKADGALKSDPSGTFDP